MKPTLRTLFAKTNYASAATFHMAGPLSSCSYSPIAQLLKKAKMPVWGILAFLFLTMGAHKSWGQTPTDGDYRTSAIGALNWNTAASWQVRSGSNWAVAVTPPTASNNVYIQAGSTVTVNIATADCKDLHINSATSSIVALGVNTLQVSGKLRAYQGTAVFTVGADGTFYSGQSSTSTVGSACISSTAGSGKLKFIGVSRTLCNTGEWGNDPQAWDSEFAPTSGQTLTIQTGFKSRNVTISSGTVVSSSADFRPDGGATGTGTLTVKSGSVLQFSGNTINIKRVGTASSTSHFSTLTVESGATLDFSGTSNPTIGASTFVFSGTVSYSGSGAQTLAGKGGNSGGADPTSYTNVTLTGSGTKTTLASLTTSISGTLSLRGSASLALGASAILSYGGSSTLEYASSTINQLITDIEFPNTGGPANISINNTFGGTGVTLNIFKAITGSLNLVAGNFADGGNQFTVGGNITGTSSHSGAGKIIMTGAGKTISGATLGNLEINSGGTITLNGSPMVNGDLTLTAGTLADGGNTLTLAGNILGTASHTSTGSGEILMTGSSKFIGAVSLGNLDIQSGALIGLALNAAVNGNLNLGGTLAGAGLTLTLSGNITGTGTETNTGGKILMTGSGKTISGASLANLELSNAGGFSLTGSPTISTLVFTNGKLSLGAFDLTCSTITGATSTKYIVTDAAGVLKISCPAATVVSFPIGSSATSYDEVTLKPTTTSTFSVRVKPTTVAGDFPGTIVNYGNVAPRLWDVAVSGTPGSTQVTFLNGNGGFDPTPTQVIGHYNGSWTEIAATYNTNVWTGFTSTFSPFGVGKAGAFVAPPCTDPDVPTVSATPSTICQGNSSTLSITSGNLNSATTWQWYSGSCGGTPENTGASIMVSPSITTTYFVRGEGGCVTPGACAMVTVNVTNTNSWTGATNNNWHTATNWSCGYVPNATTNVAISFGAPVISAAAVCKNMNITGLATLAISGSNVLTVEGNWNPSVGTFSPGAGLVKFNEASGTQFIAPSTSTFYDVEHSGGGTMNVSGNPLNVTNSLNLSAGTLELQAVNVTAGELKGNGAITTIVASSIITVGSIGTNTIYSGTISQAGGTISLVKNGAGSLTLSGPNTYTGVTTINGGIVICNTLANGGAASSIGSSSNAASNLVFTGGTLAYTGPTTTINRNFTLNTFAFPNIDVAAGMTLTISGGGTGNGGINKTGAGTLEFTGSNTYTGATFISVGKLQLNRPGGATLPSTATVTMTGSATLQVSTNQTLTNLTLGPGVNLIVDGGATLTITGILNQSGGTITGAGAIAYGPVGKLTYGGSMPQTAAAEFPAANGPVTLEIQNSGSAIVTLPFSRTITGLLMMTTGHLALGNNDLTVGSFNGGTLTSHVITDGTGHLKASVPVSNNYTFPVGISSGSFDPVQISPSVTSVLYGVNVIEKLSAMAFTPSINNFALAAPRQWDVDAPGAGTTTVKFTDGNATALSAPYVVGHSNLVTWQEFPAVSHVGNTWELSTSTFSPFGVGKAGAFFPLCTSPSVSSDPEDATICENDNITFTGSFTGGDPVPTLVWQESTDGGTNWNDLTETAPYSGTTSNALIIMSVPFSFNGNQYRLKATNDCGDVFTSNAILTVNELPVMDCPDDITVCSNDTPFQMTATPTGGTYTGSPGIVDPDMFDPSIADDGINTITYTYTDMATGCSNSCMFNINVLRSPPNTIHQPSNAPYVVCGLSGPLNAKNPAGGAQGTWTYSAMSGTLSFSNIHAANATVTASQYGVYNLTWTVVAPNGCSTARTTTITFNQAPTVTCPANAEYCETEPGFTLTGGSPAGGVYTQNNIAQTFFNPFTEGPGVHTITYTVTDAGNGCTASCSFTITVFDQPSVVAGPPQTVCSNVDVTVNGSIGGGATSAHWTMSGDGSFANADALSTTYHFGPGDLSSGSVILILTTNDPAGPCNLVSDNSLVTINPSPNANAGDDDVVCALVYQLNANPSPGATGIWTTSGAVNFVDNTDPHTMVTADDYGTYTFTWTETIGTCADADDVTITFNLAPDVTCPGPSNVCINSDPIELTGGMPPGGTYSGPGVAMGMFDPAVAGSGTKTITYTYTGENGCSGSCEFSINVYTLPTPDAGPDDTACDLIYQLNGSDPSGGMASWSQVIGPGTAVFSPSATDPNATVTVSLPGAYVFRWSITNGACFASNDVLITFIENLPCFISGTASVCPNADGIMFTGIGGMNSYHWTITGNGTISSPDDEQDVLVNAGGACGEDFELTLEITFGQNCSSTCMQAVHVEDMIAPQFTNCPSETFTLGCNPTITMEEAITDAGGATDNCGDIIYSATPGMVSGDCMKTQTWTVVATDGCGNSNSCQVHYSWSSDTQIPQFLSCPGIVYLGCNPNPMALPTDASVLIAAGAPSENCTIASVSVTHGLVTGACEKTQIWTVTAVDECGNTGTCEIAYNWTVDVIAPVFDNCPAGPLMRLCNSGPFSQFDAAIAMVTATDNCGDPVKTISGGLVTGTCLKTQTYFVTATDACGNASTCSVVFQWYADTEAPLFDNCGSNTVQLGCVLESQPVTEAQAIAAVGGVSDNCGIASETAEISTDDVTGCFHIQTWLITAIDHCDQSSYCSVTYTWTVDGGGPVFSNCPAPNIDLGLNPVPITEAQAISDAGAITDGGCAIQTSATGGTITGNCTQFQTWTVTASDDCGHSSTCSVHYTWTVTPPAVICPPDVTITLANLPFDLTSLVYSPGGGIFTGPFVSDNIFNTVSTGSYTVTYTYTLPNGCSNSCDFDIEVISDACTPPVVSTNPMPQHICQTDIATFTGSFTGSEPITYQWEYYDPNLMVWKPIIDQAPFSGATTSTITITGPAFFFNGIPFHLIATNDCGTVTTEQAILTVDENIVAFAGGDNSTCGLNYQLNGNSAGTGTGTWMMTNGTGTATFDDENDPFTTVHMSGMEPYGEKEFTWTIVNGLCTTSDVVLITFNQLPAVTCPPDITLCKFSGPPFYNIPNGSPFGGFYSGEWVFGTSFFTLFAPPGAYPITYHYFDPETYCEGTCTFTITVADPPFVSPGYYDPVCQNAPDVTLNQELPVGGTYSGTGVSGNVIDGFVFDPSVGMQNILYTYTDPVSGCSNGTFPYIQVYSAPDPVFGNYPPVCLSSPDVALNATPSGGTWIGTGVSGDVMNGFFFDPSVGTQTLTYTYTSVDGCIVVGTLTIISTDILMVICPGDFDYCTSAGNYDLSTLSVQPAGGVFTGNGVAGNIFNPVVAGPGETLITYTYDYGDGCSGFCTFTINVLPDEVGPVSGGMYPAVCQDIGIVFLDEGTPTGGVWTGNNVSYDPMNGYYFYTYSGTQTLTYTVTGENGCSSSAQVDIIVNPNPSPYFIPQEACSGEDPFLLTAAVPFDPNGIYSGPGVTANIFYPSVVGKGFYFLSYVVTDANGCSGGGSFPMNVYDAPELSCPTNPITIDVDEPPLFLTVGTPGGGVYSGPGISGKYFFPAVAGEGTHTITYTYTVGNSACQVICTFQIIVSPANPCPHDFTTCIDASSVDLTTLEPNGGSYSGDGVTMNVFNPSVAGAGAHTITHTYDLGEGEMTCTFVITVAGPPVVTCPADFLICADHYGTFILSGGMPEGGYYSGDYVPDGVVFYAQMAGAGVHPITYHYTDPVTGCSNTCTFNITVIFESQIDAGTYPPVCVEDGNVVLTGFPAGGTFTGNGVSGDPMTGFVFDPSVGTTTVTYAFTDPVAMCQKDDIAVITVLTSPPVVMCPADMTLCKNDNSILLTATPEGGTYSGSNGIVNGNMFDPTEASVGEHMITYTYPPSGSCSMSCTFMITVNALPAVSCPPSIQACLFQPPFALTGGMPSGGTYAGEGVFDGIFTPVAAGLGFHSISYTVTDPETLCTNHCFFDIEVLLPPNAIAGSYGPLCSNGAALGLMGSPGNGVWTGTGVTGNQMDGYAFDPSVGTQTLMYTVTIGECSSFAFTTINVNEPPLAPVCPEDMTFCRNDAAFQLTPFVEPNPYSPSTGIVTDFINYYFDPSEAGTGVYPITYTVTDPETGCSNTCDFTFTVLALPVVTCPGEMQVNINATPFALTGGLPVGGTYTGDGVTNGIFDPAAAGLDFHSITYTVTDPTTMCTNHCFFDIEVISGDCTPPVLSTSPMSQHICQNASAMFTGSFTGSPTITYQWEYSDDGGMTWAPVPNGAPYTGETTSTLTITAPTLQYNNYLYRLHATNACGNDVSSAATLTLDQYFEAIAGDDNATCGLVYNLLGNDQGFANATWSMTSGTGIAAFDDETVSTTTVHMSGVGAYGTKEFTWTITNGLCTSSDAVLITFNEPPTLSLPSSVSACTNEAPFALSGNPPGGTFSGTGVVGNQFDPSISGPGTFTVTYMYTAMNGCTSSGSYPVDVQQAVPTNAGADFNSCPLQDGLGNPIYADALHATTNPGFDIGIWTGNGPGTVMFTTPGSPNTGVIVSLPGIYTFTWTETNFPCTTSDDVVVNFYPYPAVICPGDLSVCTTTAPFQLGATPLGGTYFGPGVSMSGLFNPVTAGVGTHLITYSYTDPVTLCLGFCNFNITVSAPAVADAGPDLISCDLFAFLNSAPTAGTGVWTYTGPPMGTVTFTPNASTPDVNVHASIAGVYTFTWTVTNGACVTSDMANVTFGTPPVCQIDGPATVCPNSLNTYSGPSGMNSYYWTILSGNASIVGAMDQQEVTVNAGATCPGSYVLQLDIADAAGCPSICSVTVVVQDNSVPVFTDCPTDIWGLQCNPAEGIPSEALVISLAGTVTDACGSVTESAELTTNTVDGCWHTKIYTVTATDGCGNTATCSVHFEYKVTPGPVFNNCPAAPINLGNNPPPITAEQAIAASGGAIDNCSFTYYSATGGMITGTCNQSQTWTVTAHDDCIISTTCEVTYVWTQLPSVNAGNYGPVCDYAGTIALLGTPEGGVWSGPGVIGDMEGYQFNPGAGTQTITYTVADNNGCTNSATTTIVVNPAPVVTCPSNITVCSSDVPFALTGGNPVGGTYTGIGVAAGMFNPASGNGPHLITYTYTDGNGCSAMCSYFITVNALPIVSCPASFSIEINAAPFALTGGAPAGGTYSGAGVNSNIFYPSTAGLGLHTITYSYSIGSCSNTCQFTITVNSGEECTPKMEWVFLPPGTNVGSCPSMTDCCTNTICYGLQYTPGTTGILEDYTTGFTLPCPGPNSPIISNSSCVMNDNSFEIESCGPPDNALLFNSSGNQGALPVFACVPVILHKVCFNLPIGASIPITEDVITDLTANIQTDPGPPSQTTTEFPVYTTTTITSPQPVAPADVTMTVACPQYAVTPVYPVVLDYCGTPIMATVTNVSDSPDPISCEGTRIYTFTYATCNVPAYTFTWHYTYNIQRNDFTLPDNGYLQVSCPDDTDTPPMLPTVVDNCNNVLTPVGDLVISVKPSCEGDRTYMYTYMDCDNNSHVWTFTYHVVREDFVIPEAINFSTIQCMADVHPELVVLPVVHSDCGELLTASVPVQNANELDTYDGCEGTISFTWTWSDCAMHSHSWTYTYVVDRTTAPAIFTPAPVSSTIECFANAESPALPVVKDVCGFVLNPSGAPTPGGTYDGCEGTYTLTYHYFDCSGLPFDWTYTYTIDRVTPPSEVGPPASTSTTIECLSEALPPVLPFVQDVCQNTLQPQGAPTISGTYAGCEGTYILTYHYTDCSDLSFDWSYTYNIDIVTPPMETSDPPVPTASSVECLSDAVLPLLPTVEATCGQAGLPKVLLLHADFAGYVADVQSKLVATGAFSAVDLYDGGSNTPTLAELNGYNAVLVYSNFGWANADLLGDNLAAYVDGGGGVVTAIFAASGANFGLIGGAFSSTSDYQVIVPSSATGFSHAYLGMIHMPGHPLMSGVTSFDGGDGSYRSTSTTLAPGGYRVADWTDGTMLITARDNAGAGGNRKRVDLGMFPASSDVEPGFFWLSSTSGATIMKNALQYVASSSSQLTPVSITYTDSPSSISCEGSRTYTVNYEDCSGLDYVWNYTYTIEHVTPPVVPSDGFSTVSCPGDATIPAATLPGYTYVGAIGSHTYFVSNDPTNWLNAKTLAENLGAHLASISNAGENAVVAQAIPFTFNNTAWIGLTDEVSEGDYVWVDGTPFTYSNWSSGEPNNLNDEDYIHMYLDGTWNDLDPDAEFQYVIEFDATPNVLPHVTDVCGVPIEPTGPVTGGDYDGCEGTISYTFTYTDCADLSSDWIYTYTVVREDFTIPETLDNSTVDCAADAVSGTVVLPVVLACGELVPSGPLQNQFDTDTYDGCEGTISYTWTYADCALHSHTWTYTYTVLRQDFTIPATLDHSTVDCAADAVSGTIVPPIVYSDCTELLEPSGPYLNQIEADTYNGCEGTISYTWMYTDCALHSHAWKYTYTVHRQDFSIPETLDHSTVDCAADAISGTVVLPIVNSDCDELLESGDPVLNQFETDTYDGCEGTISYTWTYTDCALHSHTWTYTYTIERQDFSIPQTLDHSTVACAITINPLSIILPVVQSDCSELLEPSGPVLNQFETDTYDGCEGTISYTWTYQDCKLNTHAWTYTYTVDLPDFDPPNNVTLTVGCVGFAVEANVQFLQVLSSCGVELNHGPATPNEFGTDTYNGCQGTKSFTYSYMDCAGDVHLWTYTFNIVPAAPVQQGNPVPTSSIINCYLNATPPVLPSFFDGCGFQVMPAGPVIGGTNTGGCDGTITYTYTYTTCSGVSIPWVYTYYVSCDAVQLKVWLEGPYNLATHNMNTTMNGLHTLPGQNAPLFYLDYPAGEPYNLAPWNYNGMPTNTGVQWGDFGGQTPYPPDVVDWVLVTIRKNGILPANNIWTCAGWVHQNGDVTFPENCALPPFTTADLYYFVVQHRNHLGILSPSDVDMPCGTAVLQWDFRNSNSYQPLFRFGQKQVEPGVWAMYGANGEQVNSIQAINSLDRTLWKTQQSNHGYYLGDFDLNAYTDGFDETLWKNNQNRTTGVVFY